MSDTTNGAGDNAAPLTIAAMRFAALLMAVLGFLPLANWIAGGHEMANYSQNASEWLNGSLIVGGVAVVLTILSGRYPIWREGMFDGLVRHSRTRPHTTGLVLGLAAFLVYSAAALWVLSGRPLLIDEVGHILQARIFAGGHIWLDPPQHPEFFSALHVIDFGGKYYTHFPPGGPLLFVPAVALRTPWLVGPVFGALSVVTFWGITRRAERRPAIALGAAVLFAFAPFVIFLSGSYMNHVPTLTFVLLAVYALARQMEDDAPHLGAAALCGLSLGLAATIRPLDAVAFALPAGLWMLWRTIRKPSHLPELIAAGLALAIPVTGVLWYNRVTTGHVFLFPYEVLWGKSHGLGFHRAPWGDPHTPIRGLELINLYFLRLQTNLFEAAAPSLVPAIGALALTRVVRPLDRFFLWTGGLVVALYFSYWGDGIYLGARFFLVLAPALALWTARFPAAVRDAVPSARALHRGVGFALAAAVAVAIAVTIPFRATAYRNGFVSMRTDLVRLTDGAGVRNALIFIRESWGAQMISRLWSLGVPRSETEALYRSIDACVLDRAIDDLETAGVRDTAALLELQKLTGDSARLVKRVLSPDKTLRLLPGATYSAQCRERVLEDRAGFTIAASVLAQEWGTNIYARDLHARDTLLLQQYPGRAVYLIRALGSDVRARIVLERPDRDSLAHSWGVPVTRLGADTNSATRGR